MKVQQETSPYRTITIKLENLREAVALFGLVDKVENYRCTEDQEIELTEDEIALIVELSNLNTNMDINL